MLDLFIAHLWTVCWPCKDAWNVPVTRGVRCDKSVARGQWAENATSTDGIPITQANYANPAIILSKVFHCASKSHIPVEQHERNHKISGSIKAAATKKERKICKRKKKQLPWNFHIFYVCGHFRVCSFTAPIPNLYLDLPVQPQRLPLHNPGAGMLSAW